MNPLLQISPFSADGGEIIGRNPKDITIDEFREHLPDALIGFKAIRAKCLECSNGSATEVRKCVCVDCPLWPLRMGSQPKGLRKARKQESSS